eukprot:2668952-Rhodomonas_salina.1
MSYVSTGHRLARAYQLCTSVPDITYGVHSSSASQYRTSPTGVCACAPVVGLERGQVVAMPRPKLHRHCVSSVPNHTAIVPAASQTARCVSSRHSKWRHCSHKRRQLAPVCGPCRPPRACRWARRTASATCSTVP